jgi:hypothetical protein
MADISSKMELNDEAVHVELTYDHLDAVSIMNQVRSPKAGAIVLFAGNICCLSVTIPEAHFKNQGRLEIHLTPNPSSSSNTRHTQLWP